MKGQMRMGRLLQYERNASLDCNSFQLRYGENHLNA